MKLGIAMALTHKNAEEWAKKHCELGLSSVVFPCSHTEKTAVIDSYVDAAKEYGLTIAEVGAWKNLLSPDGKEQKINFDYCKNQLELADYVEACCCVNISGAKGRVWDGGYKDNYSQKTYEEIIETVQRLVDSVNPQKTFYTLEPMPWMHPDSPEDYLKMIKDINRKAFGVHLDIVNMISTPQRYLFNEQFTTEAISLLGKYTKSCHIKDVLLENRLTVTLKEVLCGKGGFNLKNYIDRLDELDENMPVIIEHLNSEEEYLEGIQYINSLKDGRDE